MRSNGSVVCKQHVSDQDLFHFCLCSQAGNIKQFAIRPGVKVDTLSSFTKSMFQKHREEDPEEDPEFGMWRNEKGGSNILSRGLYLFVPVSFLSDGLIESNCLSFLLDYSQFIYEAYLIIGR